MTTLAQELGFDESQRQLIASQAFDLLEAGDLDGSINIFNGLLVLDPTDSGVHAALGSVLHEQGKFAEAEASYDAALSLDPRSVLALVNRGELRCKRGDKGGLDDLRVASTIESTLKARAQSLLRRFSR